MIVGAPYTAFKVGTAYMYQRSGQTWSMQAKLQLPDGKVDDYFGQALEISGDMALVGAGYRNEGTGAVYAYQRNGNTWAQTQVITASDGEKNELFGASLSLCGSRLLIGALKDGSKPFGNGGVSQCGSAYMFSLENGKWKPCLKQLHPSLIQLDSFGSSVAITENTFYGGARPFIQQGQVYAWDIGY